MVAAHPSLKEELPFLRSVLNRCNRIPPNADFSLDDPYNVTQLKTAILVHGEKDRSTSNLVVQRVPKYSALLGPHKCHVVPSNLSTFFDNENENVEQLMKNLGRARKRRASVSGPLAGAVAEGAIPESSKKRVIIVHNHIESAQRLVEACRQQSVEAILLKVGDLKWYVYCKEIETCLVLLTPEFMRSSWCEGQLTFATDMRKAVIPIVLDEVTFAILDHFDGRLSHNPSYLTEAETNQTDRLFIEKVSSILSPAELDTSELDSIATTLSASSKLWNVAQDSLDSPQMREALSLPCSLRENSAEPTWLSSAKLDSEEIRKSLSQL
jgi:hypothetical protein